MISDQHCRRRNRYDLAVERTTRRRGNQRRDSVLKAAARTSADRRRARRRLALFLTVLLGIPAILFGLAWGGHAAWRALLAENDFFLIRHIEVTTDGDLPTGHILEFGRVQVGVNLFAVNLREVRELLLKVPVVAEVRVGRRLPDTLQIAVLERVAVARLGRPGVGTPLAVDATGHVLGPSAVRPGLPVVVGVRDQALRPGDVIEDPMLGEALRILDICRHPEMHPILPVTTIDIRHPERHELHLAGGERAMLSRDDIEDKLERLRVIRSETDRLGLDLADFDLTVDRNFVGRPASWQDPAAAAREGDSAGGMKR